MNQFQAFVFVISSYIGSTTLVREKDVLFEFDLTLVLLK